MDCKHANEHLVDFLYQEVDADEADRMEGHLRRCAHCAEQLDQLDATRRLLQQLPEVTPSPSVTASIMQQAERAVQPERPPLWERIQRGLRLLVLNPAMTAAAALVLVLGVSFYAYRQSSPPPSGRLAPPRPAPVLGTVPSPAGETAGSEAAEGVGQQVVPQGAAEEDERPEPPPAATPQATVEQKPRFAAQRERKAKRAPRKARPRRRARGAAMGRKARKSDLALAETSKRVDSAARSGAGLATQRRGGRTLPGTANEPAPRPKSGAIGGAKQTAAAQTLLARARAARRAQRWLEALRTYNQALQLDPGLRRTMEPEVRSCARRLASQDVAQLERARRTLPLLAGWLEAELAQARGSRLRRSRPKRPAVDLEQRNAAPTGD